VPQVPAQFLVIARNPTTTTPLSLRGPAEAISVAARGRLRNLGKTTTGFSLIEIASSRLLAMTKGAVRNDPGAWMWPRAIHVVTGLVTVFSQRGTWNLKLGTSALGLIPLFEL
jgi:hypothetical protein